jgi:hypothetical protein
LEQQTLIFFFFVLLFDGFAETSFFCAGLLELVLELVQPLLLLLLLLLLVLLLLLLLCGFCFRPGYFVETQLLLQRHELSACGAQLGSQLGGISLELPLGVLQALDLVVTPGQRCRCCLRCSETQNEKGDEASRCTGQERLLCLKS